MSTYWEVFVVGLIVGMVLSPSLLFVMLMNNKKDKED